MDAPVRYAILGCGMMGQEHARNIALLPNAHVAVVMEPDPQMAAVAHAITGAPVVETLDDALLRDDVDGVVIASPNHCHMDQLEAIAATRTLPLLVEKPLFSAAGDAERIKTFAKSYEAPVWVAMEYRYMPPIAALLEAMDQAVGQPVMLAIREHRFPFLQKVGDWNRFNRFTGGTFVEKCCHFFDLMRLILRSEPVRVMASASQAVNHLDERYEGETPDILDNGYAIVDFASGARAMLDLCMFAEGARFQEEICVVGGQGKLEAFVPGPGRFWPERLGPLPVPRLVVSPRAPKRPRDIAIPVDPGLLKAGDHNGATFYQHERFAALVRGTLKAPEVSLRDGEAAVLMGLAAQKSAATGEAVLLV
ncbi:MAG: Gfo/Idh/MocA family oxidoreductase [Devosia sp.]